MNVFNQQTLKQQLKIFEYNIGRLTGIERSRWWFHQHRPRGRQMRMISFINLINFPLWVICYINGWIPPTWQLIYFPITMMVYIFALVVLADICAYLPGKLMFRPPPEVFERYRNRQGFEWLYRSFVRIGPFYIFYGDALVTSLHPERKT